MKTDHPRAIDRYIDFFGEGTGMRSAAPDTWTMAIATSQPIDPATLTAGLPKLAEATLTRVLKT